jgi:small subunit ribosomal protein S18
MSTPTKPRPTGGRSMGSGGPRRRFARKKFCRFCAEKELQINYKNVYMLKSYISERGKIVPRRITGTCATHQRKLTLEIKKARIVALVPFTATQVR